MKRLYQESGRSLLETLAVLVVIAILTLAGLLGYNVLVHQWRKHETVKRISELTMRYKLHPIAAKNGIVEIKPIFPEVERASSIEMKTPDTETGRVSLHVEESSSFAVIVNQILNDSCEAMLADGEYDSVLLTNGEEYSKEKEYMGLGKDYLATFDFALLNPDQQAELKKIGIDEKSTKDEVISTLCKGTGHLRNVALVSGSSCPRVGASYWYRGRCWTCPSAQKEDKYGACCSEEKINSNKCHVCNCPSGNVCDESGKNPSYTCVECVKDEDCSKRGKGVCENKKCVPCHPFDVSGNGTTGWYSKGCEATKDTKPWCSDKYRCEECLTNYLEKNEKYDCRASYPQCNKEGGLGNWKCTGCTWPRKFGDHNQCICDTTPDPDKGNRQRCSEGEDACPCPDGEVCNVTDPTDPSKKWCGCEPVHSDLVAPAGG